MPPAHRSAAAAVALAALVLIASGCGGATTRAVTVSASGAPLDGRGLYTANCAACHGAALQGTPQGPPFLDAVYRPGHHADAAFLIAVRRGTQPHHWNFGPMAPVPGLTDPQVAAITAFVRAEQQAVGVR